MKLILVRHGETDYNKNEIRQGQLDIELNQTGRNQAVEAAERLFDAHFDYAISSDLKRAAETASIVMQELGDDLAVVTTPKLREQSLGKWEDLSYADTPMKELTFDEKIGETGESYKDLYTRVAESVNRMLSSADDLSILIFTHKGVIAAILNMLSESTEVVKEIPNATPIEVEITEKLKVPVK